MSGKPKTKLNIASTSARGTFARKWSTVALVCAYVISSLVGGFVYNVAPAEAAIPKYINFQGKLTIATAGSTQGTNVANGTYAIQFKLYDALTAGTLLWTETYDQAPVNACQKIQVTNGVFNAKLGSCASLAGVDFTGGSLYLTVNFAPTGTAYDGEMSPRKQLVSSAYAFVANSVSGDGVVNNAVQSATALSTGRTSANPALQVDTNTASSVTGLKVTSAAAAGGLALAVISSGTNENLTLDAKGSGTISLGSNSTGDILLGGGSGATGCTVTNSNGNLVCSGSVSISNGEAVLSGASGRLFGPKSLFANIYIDNSLFWTDSSDLALQAGNGGAGTGNMNLIFKTRSTETARIDSNGYLGIGDSSPAALLTVGNGDLFQVNSSGAIAAATGITSSGTINFSSLTASSAVYTDGSKNLTSAAPTSGSLGYWSRTGTTLQPTTSGDSISVPGAGANSEKFGAGATAVGGQSTALGYGASSAGGQGVAIGYSSSAGPGGGVAIGYGNIVSNAYGVSVGRSAGASAYDVALGSFATTTGDSGSIAIGYSTVASSYGIAIGNGSSASYTSSIAIGKASATTAANQLVFGSDGFAASDIYFGDGVTSATPPSSVLNGTGGSGTNIAGGALQLAGGKGTGSAAGGDILFQTSTATTSGATLQTLATKMIIQGSTGNVGIGTLSPSSKLEVAGDVTLGNTLTFNNSPYDAFLQANDSFGSSILNSPRNWVIRSGTSSAIQFQVNGSTNALYAGSSGNVSIGNVSPVSLFNVGSSNQFQVNSSGAIAASTAINTSGSYTQTGTGANTFTGTSTFSNATYSALFTGGNVGIGTTTPVNNLEVVGNAALTDYTGGLSNTITYGPSLTATARLNLRQNISGGANLALGGDAGGGGNSTNPNIYFTDNNRAYAAISGVPGSGLFTNDQNGAIYFSTTPNVTTTALQSRMVISDAGNLGIGDTSPAALLTVGSGDLFQVNSSGAIAAATGISSSGTINFSGLTASSAVYTDASKNLTTTAPISGSLGYWSRTGTTLQPTTTNDILSIPTTNTTGADLAITNTGVYTGTGILNLTANSATTGTLGVVTGNGLTTGSLLSLSSSSTAALTGQKGINVALTGALTGAQTTYGGYFSNTRTGASAVNVGAYFTASGATGANYAAIFDQGNVGIGTTTPVAKLDVMPTTGVTNDSISIQAGLTAGSDYHNLNAAFYVKPSTIGSFDLRTRSLGLYIPQITASTSNYLVGNQNGDDGGQLAGIRMDNISTTGGASGLLWKNYGIWIKSISSNTSDAMQYGLKIDSITGGGAERYGVYIAGGDKNYFAGSVGIGDTTPAAMLTVGSGDLFQVNSSGAIAAVVGITSSSNYVQSAGTMSVASANTTQVTTASALALNVNSLTTGTGEYIASSSLTSGKLLDIQSNGTGALTGQTGLNIAIQGTNATAAQTTYGAQISNTHAGTTSTNVGLNVSVSGGTTANYAALFNGGNVGIGTSSPGDILEVRKDQVSTNVATTTKLLITNASTSGVASLSFSDGTTATGGLQYNNTTGSKNLFSSSYTDIPYYFGTNNSIRMTVGAGANAGNIGIGTTAPASMLSVGSSNQFQVNSSGAIAAATGIASSGTIAFSGLSTNGAVYTSGGTGTLTTTAPTSGSLGYWSRTGTLLSPATSGDSLSVPGAGTNSEKFGAGATAAGNNSLAVGYFASAAGGNSTALGYNANASSSSSIAIGLSSVAGLSSTVVGTGASAAGQFGVAIGYGATATPNGSMAIGYGATSDSASIVMGIGATSTSTYQFVAGATSYPTNNVYFGKGVTDATPTAYTLNGTGGSGTDIAGGALQLAGGKGTGSAAGGDILFQTSTATTSGATLQTLATKMTIQGSTGNVGIGTNTPTKKLQVMGPIALNDSSYIDAASGYTIFLTSTNSAQPIKVGGLVVSSSYADTAPVNGAYISGSVGIGTSTPGAKLDLKDGSMYFSNTNVSQPITSVWPATTYLAVSPTSGTDGGANLVGLSDTDAPAMTIGGIIGTTTPSTTTPAVVFLASKTLNSSSSANLGSTDTAFQFRNQNTNIVTILGSGNFGIGTSSPGGLLDIKGSSTGDILSRVWNADASGTGTSTIRIANSGNNSQGSKLQFTDDSYYTGTIAGDRTNGLSFRTGTISGTEAGLSNRMTILPGGNIGIGDTTPASLLTVGSGDLFQVNSSGAIAAAVGITSSSNYIQSAGTMSLTSANTTQVTTASALALNVNSLTTGTGEYIASSSLTSGKLLDIQSNGTGALTGQTGLNIATQGTNGTAAQTTYGAQISNTHAGTTSTNVGLNVTVANGTTANYAALFNGGNVGIGTSSPSHKLTVTGGNLAVESGNIYLASANLLYFDYGISNNYSISKSGTNLLFNTGGTFAFSSGSVGIGNSAPASLLSVGSSSQFQVNSSGAIAAATGIASSGTIAFSGLSTNGAVYTSGGTGTLTTTAPTSGAIGYLSRTGTTLQPTTANDVFSIPTNNTTGADLSLTNTGVYTGTGILNLTANSATTGTLGLVTSTSLTSGNLLSLSSNGTAGLTGQAGLNIALQGTNATAAQTTYGAKISNTHAGTTSTNIGLSVTVGSGTTANYAALFNGGNVGIGDTTPVALFTVGNGDLFQVDASGGVITSGDILLTGGTRTIDNPDLSLILSSSYWGTSLTLDNSVATFNTNVSTSGLVYGKSFETPSVDYGSGVAGNYLKLGNNSNRSGGAGGYIDFVNSLGIDGYVWQDGAGYMRIGTTIPTNSYDYSGTVIGDQTSTRDTKQDITDYTDLAGALQKVTSAPLHTFRYIKDVQGYGTDNPLAKTRIGYIADEVPGEFMWGNSIDQVSVNGLLMGSIQQLNKITVQYNTNGNVGIGLPEGEVANEKLVVAGNAIIEGDLVTQGTVTAHEFVTDGNADVAENYVTADASLVAGELVSIDPAAQSTVKRTAIAEHAMGVVSTAPGLTLGGNVGDSSALSVPVALAGRVPVKVTIENGAIAAGDFLTASATIPGAAMKATKAGPVIGQALADYAATVTGNILVFVNPTSYNGADIESEIAGLIFDYSEIDNTAQTSEQMLEYLLAQLPNLDQDNLSEMNTDVVIAGAEVVSPNVTTQNLRTDFLSSATSDGSLTVASATVMNGGLIVDTIGSIGDLLSINSDVEFFGTPYFTADTAGFAVIKAGVQTVDVTFGHEYLAQPIVNASVSFEQDIDQANLNDAAREVLKNDAIAATQSFLAQGISYAVTNKSKFGFTIVLSKAPTSDVKMSWTAFAVRNASTFMSLNAPAGAGDASPGSADLGDTSTPPTDPTITTPPTDSAPVTDSTPPTDPSTDATPAT
jgi:Head domain of trimeric autotransporter adhesin